MTGNDSGDIISDMVQENKGLYGWDDLTETDRRYIRQFLQRRRKAGADDDAVRHDFWVLVGLATIEADGRLSSAQLRDFDEPTDRPNRALAHFLIFVGAEAPPCPKCGEQDYLPAEDFPEKMRCHGCAFLFSIQELARMAYSQQECGDIYL